MKADTFAFFAHFSEHILLCLDNNGDKGCKKFSDVTSSVWCCL